MKRILQCIFIVSYLLYLPFLQSYGQLYTIDKLADLKGDVQPRGISSDQRGNSYFMGEFKSRVVFGTKQLTAKGTSSICIAKFDPDGKCLWAAQAYGSSVQCNGIATDENGDSYLTGSFQGTITLDQFTLTSAGENDIFIAKYDTDGNCIWIRQGGGSENDAGSGIAYSPNYGIYITGFFYGSMTLGSYKLTSSGGSDVFLARYDPNGICIWAKKAGGINDDEGLRIASDNNGNCVVAGAYGQSAVFDSIEISLWGGVFLAGYNTKGDILWVKNVVKTDYYSAGITGLAIDEKGNTFLSRNYQHSFYMAKYNLGGNLSWEKAIDEPHQASHITNCGISTDNKGNAYIAGSYYKIDYLDSVYLGFDYEKHNYIAGCDSSGTFRWAKKFDPGTTLTTVSVTKNNHCYITGYYDGGAVILKTADPNLEITSPAGNEVWQINTQHNITWKSNDDGMLKIELTTDNGNEWISLSNSVSAGRENYAFRVPPVSSSGNCKIKLTSLSYQLYSTSAGNFTITAKDVPGITLTSPNVSLNLPTGSDQIISWSFNGSIKNVKLEYSTDAGINWISINNSVPASLKEYSWIVPNTPSERCWVRVTDAADPKINDISDEFFKISFFENPPLKIISPLNGEVLKAGTKKEIKWQSSSSNNQLNIFYSSALNQDWNLIATVAASTGSYIWTIPEVTSTDCRIRISDDQSPNLFDESGTFTIWTPIYYTFNPPSGQISQSFGNTNISLNAYIILPSQIIVFYNFWEVPAPGLLPDGIITVSPYYWEISSKGLSFFNGVLSIPISTLSDVIDKTRLVWLRRDNPGEAWMNLDGEIAGGFLVNKVKFSRFGEFAIGTNDNSNPSPALIYPADNSTNIPNIINLIWSDSVGAESYRLQVSNDSLFNSLFIDDSTVTSTSKQISGLTVSTKHFWRVSAKRQKGVSHYSDVWSFNTVTSTMVDKNNFIPKEFEMFQNYPNPFNPVTIIKYGLPVESHVRLIIYNAIGEYITELADAIEPAGYKEIKFDASKLSSGIYFCSMIAVSKDGGRRERIIKKIILLK